MIVYTCFFLMFQSFFLSHFELPLASHSLSQPLGETRPCEHEAAAVYQAGVADTFSSTLLCSLRQAWSDGWGWERLVVVVLRRWWGGRTSRAGKRGSFQVMRKDRDRKMIQVEKLFLPWGVNVHEQVLWVAVKHHRRQQCFQPPNYGWKQQQCWRWTQNLKFGLIRFK